MLVIEPDNNRSTHQKHMISKMHSFVIFEKKRKKNSLCQFLSVRHKCRQSYSHSALSQCYSLYVPPYFILSQYTVEQLLSGVRKGKEDVKPYTTRGAERDKVSERDGQRERESILSEKKVKIHIQYVL